MDIFEILMKELFQKVMGREIDTPIPRLEYIEAMDRFGTDRPDIRFNMELRDITDLVSDSNFKVFKSVVKKGGIVKAIKAEKTADKFSRKILDGLSESVIKYGAKGLAWVKITDKGWQSSLSKFFQDSEREAINHRTKALPGDLLLIVADDRGTVNKSLGMLRQELAERLEIIKKDEYSFLWVTKFPLLEVDETEGRLQAVHHPFTAPLDEDIKLLKTNPTRVRAKAYDLVLNGVEVGGGSVRIHDIDLQEEIFTILGISREEADRKFGFFLEALRYGAPPHAGMAIGFDRLVAIMAGVDSIREVIAFPKTSSATCPLTDAPSRVDSAQLRELALQSVSE
jgi:aspartyl-tRNA synthetase